MLVIISEHGNMSDLRSALYDQNEGDIMQFAVNKTFKVQASDIQQDICSPW